MGVPYLFNLDGEVAPWRPAEAATLNCISPTYLLNPMHARTPRKRRDTMRSLHPMGWFGRPEDVYGAVVFLASDASNYITGHDLMIDGGHTLNAWLEPLARETPPLVSREEELVSLKHDLDVLGIAYDEDGVARPKGS